MIGGAVKMFVFWCVGLLLLYVLYGHKLTELAALKEDAPQTAVAAPSASALARSGVQAHDSYANTLVYRADKRGHVQLDGVVNGGRVRLLVDTGASSVALTMQDAMAAGISRSSLVFDRQVSTANGITRVAPVTLREIRLGQFSVYDVPAVVHENLNVSLLGQTFLKRLDSYEMRDGVLTLFWK